MKLVIKDQHGAELNLERVSLIAGGIEIILGDDIPQTIVDAAVPPVEPLSQKAEAFLAEIPELPQVGDSAPKTESIFSEGTGNTNTTSRSVVKEVAQGIDELAAERLADVKLDIEGCPWDARIHSSSEKQTAKKIWAKRKNLPEGLYDQIKAELLSGTAQPKLQEISTDRPTPKTQPVSAVAAGKQAPPPVPPVPGAVEPAAQNVPTPPAGAATPPPPPAPVPDNNVIGDSNDSDLDNIMSKWGTPGK